jgi:hypothetical protein
MESYLIKNSLLSTFMVAEVHAIWSKNVTTTMAEQASKRNDEERTRVRR